MEAGIGSHSSNNPVLSVVVALYNCESTIEQVLQSLIDEYESGAPPFEVIVVDNNSTDGSAVSVARFVEKYLFVRTVTEFNQGLSFTKNRGLKESSGQYVFFIDANKVPKKGLVKTVVASYKDTKPEPLSVGGQYLPEYNIKLPRWYDSVFDIRSWGSEARFLKPQEAELGFVGGCCSFNREVISAYGGFDTTLGMSGDKIRGGEETNLYWRIFKDNKERAGSIFYYHPDVAVTVAVPKEKTTLKYRIRRSIGFGVSARISSSRQRPLWKYLAGFPLPFVETIKVATSTFSRKELKFSTRVVMLLSRFCWYCGYYYTIEKKG